MKRQTRSLVRAFLQGFTGAGLFRRLNYPGTPRYAIDLRSIEDIKASGEFNETVGLLLENRPSLRATDEAVLMGR